MAFYLKKNGLAGPWRTCAWVVYVVCGAGLLMFLVSRRSSEPLFWGRYSLSYFIFLILFAAILVGVGFFLNALSRKKAHGVFRNLALLIVLFLSMELAGRTDAFLHPYDQVLFLQADRVLGWRSVADFKWLATGRGDADFKTPVASNHRGFHDVDHSVTKPAGKLRAVVLGDSFVEAVQVPLEKTAVRVLEKMLQVNPLEASGQRPSEVFNGGVSNYGVGQSYLLWKNEFREVLPDVVFLLVAGMSLNCTVSRYESGAFDNAHKKKLWIRPIFELEKGLLTFRPARDFEEFSSLQQDLVKNNGGSRVFRVRDEGSFLSSYLHDLWQQVDRSLIRSLNRFQRRMMKNEDQEVSSGVIKVNLKLLSKWNRELQADSTQLVLVDLSRFVDSHSHLPESLEGFSRANGCGYIPLGQKLLLEEKKKPVRWRSNSHLNEHGNQIFATAMADWLRSFGQLEISKSDKEISFHAV